LSLVEVLVSTVIVGGMLVSAMYTVSAARLGEHKVAGNTRGLMLAQDLMEEILQQPYEDPEEPGGVGPETGESGTTRADFDDLDDYVGWSSQPPVNKDGSAIPWADGYKREAIVNWLDPVDLTSISMSDTRLGRIEVKVSHDGQPDVALVAVRAAARPDGISVEAVRD